MADEKDETLIRLKQVDLLCDLYEETLQNGDRISPEEFLGKQGLVADHQTSTELLRELEKLEVAYRLTRLDSQRKDTEAFKPEISKRVGRYELRRPLGSGGFGEVWVAFDPQLDREIAIKIPHRGVLGDAASVERFYREARSAAKLKHANIVRVHDAGSDGSTHFIAAELIAGKTLRELCSADGMEIREAVRIVADLASAVFYAHRNQIVHRDIKPGNVLVDIYHQPHLTDFGLASQLDASALTANGTVLGTPIYMAPEQAAGRFGAALPACDQYSLGTVLYELLTGRPPFSGSNSVVLYHKLNTAPPSPRSIRPEIPRAIEAICLRAMERIPEKRYPDCEAMAVELRNWLNGTKEVPSVTLGRRNMWVGAILVALVVVIVFAVMKDQHAPDDRGPSMDISGVSIPVEDDPPHQVFLFTGEDPDIATKEFGVTGGHFTVIRKEPAGFHARNISNLPSACKLEVHGRVRGGLHGYWGVVLTSNDSLPAHSVLIELSARGRLRIDRGPFEGDPLATGPRFGPIEHEAIARGEEYNTLTVVVENGTLRVDVNGTSIGDSIRLDRSFLPATLALFASQEAGPKTNNPIVAEIDKIRCWKTASSANDVAIELPKKFMSSLPPTPKDAELLDSTHFLPLHSARVRKVVDFVEIHGADFDAAADWLKALGPDYCPSVIGAHASAVPSQYHAIAYRVSWPVPFRVDIASSIEEDTRNISNHGAINHHGLAYAEKVIGGGPHGEFLRTSSSDFDYYWYTLGVAEPFSDQMSDLKKRNFRPILFIPNHTLEGNKRLIVSIFAHGRRNWEAAEFLTLERLKDFADRAKAEKRFVFQIRAEVDKDHQTQFYAIALENSEQRDWDYQLEMTTSEYEAELRRRKLLGFRPTTVTSYGDPMNPKYAAAWIRYANVSKK